MKKKKIIMYCFIFIFILILLYLLGKEIINSKVKNIYKISIITDGYDNEKWETRKEGIDQAAKELNAEINFISISSKDRETEQKNAIEKEINNGTNAIILSPIDSDIISELVKIQREKLPIILVDFNLLSETDNPAISCDNYAMGKALAEEMYSLGNTRSNITIIERKSKENIFKKRKEGFLNEMKKSKNTIQIMVVPENLEEAEISLRKFFEESNFDTIVTFDSELLEMSGNIAREMALNDKNPPNIYGTGNTNKIVSCLEEKIINAIGVQNEYNVGYISTITAINTIKKKKTDFAKIDFKIVNSENIYKGENEKILFPFIK